MERLRRANAADVNEADIVIMGVPDESKSHARRKSTSAAPDILRRASNNYEFFERDGKIIPTCPMRGTFDGKRVFDAGDVNRDELYRHALDLARKKKMSIFIGGDHSLTSDVLRGITETTGEKLALLYFDAHPDFVSSTRNYYGSVLPDSAKSLDFRKSMLVGTRAAEPEELENAKRAGLQVITPLDIVDLGVRKVGTMIRERTKGIRRYISIDMDCVDPAFAPGVSVPSSGGLSSAELIYLVKSVLQDGNIAGIDIVELSPDYDFNGITASLAARIMSECIASIQLPKKRKLSN